MGDNWLIELDAVSKSYGKKLALDALSLRVNEREIYALLGPNGAGKTTTVKLIVGLLRPSSGRVSVCGFDPGSDYLAARAVLSYIPDEPYLYEKLTGREFLQFVARIFRLPPKQADDDIAQLIEQFDAREFIDDLTQNYSHGMKQRVVIAAALLHRPKVMVIDEPLVGLDPRSGKLFKDILQQKAAEGVSIIMSTHNLSLAEEMAHRVGVLNQGRLIAEGSVDSLLSGASARGNLEEVFLQLTSESPQPSGR